MFGPMLLLLLGAVVVVPILIVLGIVFYVFRVGKGEVGKDVGENRHDFPEDHDN